MIWGALSKTQTVAMMVNRVKIIRHSLSTTIAANFQSRATSWSSSSFRNCCAFVCAHTSVNLSVQIRCRSNVPSHTRMYRFIDAYVEINKWKRIKLKRKLNFKNWINLVEILSTTITTTMTTTKEWVSLKQEKQVASNTYLREVRMVQVVLFFL